MEYYNLNEACMGWIFQKPAALSLWGFDAGWSLLDVLDCRIKHSSIRDCLLDCFSVWAGLLLQDRIAYQIMCYKQQSWHRLVFISNLYLANWLPYFGFTLSNSVLYQRSLKKHTLPLAELMMSLRNTHIYFDISLNRTDEAYFTRL